METYIQLHSPLGGSGRIKLTISDNGLTIKADVGSYSANETILFSDPNAETKIDAVIDKAAAELELIFSGLLDKLKEKYKENLT